LSTLIARVVIYPLDRVIQPSNNHGLMFTLFSCPHVVGIQGTIHLHAAPDTGLLEICVEHFEEFQKPGITLRPKS